MTNGELKRVALILACTLSADWGFDHGDFLYSLSMRLIYRRIGR